MRKNKRIVSIVMVIAIMLVAMLGSLSALCAKADPQIKIVSEDGKLQVYNGSKLIKSYNSDEATTLTLTTSKSKGRTVFSFNAPNGKKRSIVLPKASGITVDGNINKLNTGSTFNTIPLTIAEGAAIGTCTITGNAPVKVFGDLGTLNVKSAPSIDFKKDSAVNKVVSTNSQVNLNIEANANLSNITAPRGTSIVGAGNTNITYGNSPSANPVTPPTNNYNNNPYYPNNNNNPYYPNNNNPYYPNNNNPYYPNYNNPYYPQQYYSVTGFTSSFSQVSIKDDKNLFTEADVSKHLLSSDAYKRITGSANSGMSYSTHTFNISGWTFKNAVDTSGTVVSGSAAYSPTDITNVQHFKPTVTFGATYNIVSNLVYPTVAIKLGAIQTAAAAAATTCSKCKAATNAPTTLHAVPDANQCANCILQCNQTAYTHGNITKTLTCKTDHKSEPCPNKEAATAAPTAHSTKAACKTSTHYTCDTSVTHTAAPCGTHYTCDTSYNVDDHAALASDDITCGHTNKCDVEPNGNHKCAANSSNKACTLTCYASGHDKATCNCSNTACAHYTAPPSTPSTP